MINCSPSIQLLGETGLGHGCIGGNVFGSAAAGGTSSKITPKRHFHRDILNGLRHAVEIKLSTELRVGERGVGGCDISVKIIEINRRRTRSVFRYKIAKDTGNGGERLLGGNLVFVEDGTMVAKSNEPT